jgi:hypothetical protein
MNHIKKLKQENELLKQGLKDLLKYIHSEKFSVDPYVNKSDIELRINEIENAVFHIDE